MKVEVVHVTNEQVKIKRLGESRSSFETCFSSEDGPLPSWSSSASLNPFRKQTHIPGMLVQGTNPASLLNTFFIA